MSSSVSLDLSLSSRLIVLTASTDTHGTKATLLVPTTSLNLAISSYGLKEMRLSTGPGPDPEHGK